MENIENIDKCAKVSAITSEGGHYRKTAKLQNCRTAELS
jgi:hypothetical protein